MVKSSAHYTCGIRWSLMDLNDCCPNICDELAAITIKFYGLLCGLKTAAPIRRNQFNFPVRSSCLRVSSIKRHCLSLIWRKITIFSEELPQRDATLLVVVRAHYSFGSAGSDLRQPQLTITMSTCVVLSSEYYWWHIVFHFDQILCHKMCSRSVSHRILSQICSNFIWIETRSGDR